MLGADVNTLEKHPIELIRILRENNPDILFEFSRYVYHPQSLSDQREIFSVPGRDIGPEWLLGILSSLEATEELALHSCVKLNNRTMHIPMIDFCQAQMTSQQYELLGQLLPRNLFKELVLYSSGRSLHGYSLRLLRPKEFLEFMGRLLLTNLPDHDAVVDERWVGHRLISGYAALRWSNNTTHYSSYPVKINLLVRLVRRKNSHQESFYLEG